VSYRIEISPPVQKEIRTLPGYVRAQARQQIRALSINPRPPHAKELRGKPAIFRIRLATRWRIAYEVDDALERVRVLRIRRKEHIDYESL
jgi:mRNA interferase RelE/StbE